MFLIYAVIVLVEFISGMIAAHAFSDHADWPEPVILFLIFLVVGFITSTKIMFFIVKMSRNIWSELPEEEADLGISLMDREVAGGWFDRWRPDLNF